jgi:hypothetical protein
VVSTSATRLHTLHSVCRVVKKKRTGLALVIVIPFVTLPCDLTRLSKCPPCPDMRRGATRPRTPLLLGFRDDHFEWRLCVSLKIPSTWFACAVIDFATCCLQWRASYPAPSLTEIGAIAIGVLHALDESLKYARERNAFSRPISSFSGDSTHC